MRQISLVIALLLMCSMFHGCSYTTKTLLPSHIQSVYVDNIKNEIDIVNERTGRDKYNIYRPGIEVNITNAILDRCLADGTLNVVHREYADAILQGSLVNYKRQPLRYNDDEEIDLYRVIIRVRIKLIDVKNKKELIEKVVIGDSNQFIIGQFASTEEDAINNALEDLAKRVVEEIIEYGW